VSDDDMPDWADRIASGRMKDRPTLPNKANGLLETVDDELNTQETENWGREILTGVVKPSGRHHLTHNWAYIALPEGGFFRINLHGGAYGDQVAAGRSGGVMIPQIPQAEGPNGFQWRPKAYGQSGSCGFQAPTNWDDPNTL
jgi:hypothetical protein